MIFQKLLIAFWGVSLVPLQSFAGRPAENLDHILNSLLKGNQRYSSGSLKHPDQSIDRLHEVAELQLPLAAILGCADSRVPPEIIFDQGIGDLFVVREAGIIIDDATIASLEYAVEHLGIQLILVLGHERCGAIDAAIHHSYHGHIGTLVDAISPAIDRVKGKHGDLADLVSRANIEIATEHLRKSRPVLFEKVKQHKLKIVGGYYDLDTGRVEITVP